MPCHTLCPHVLAPSSLWLDRAHTPVASTRKRTGAGGGAAAASTHTQALAVHCSRITTHRLMRPRATSRPRFASTLSCSSGFAAPSPASPIPCSRGSANPLAGGMFFTPAAPWLRDSCLWARQVQVCHRARRPPALLVRLLLPAGWLLSCLLREAVFVMVVMVFAAHTLARAFL